MYQACSHYLDSGVVISDLDGSNPRLLSGPACAGLHWNADGRTILCSFKNQFLLLDLETGKFTVAQNFDLNLDIGNFSISRDGRWLAADLTKAGKSFDVYVADLQTTPFTAPKFTLNEATTDGGSAFPAF